MFTIDQWHTLSKWLIIVGPIILVVVILLLSPENRKRVGDRCLVIAGGGKPTSRPGQTEALQHAIHDTVVRWKRIAAMQPFALRQRLG